MSTPKTPNPHRAAGKLAQLVGETIIHHAPWSAKIGQEARREATDEWMEELEQHTAKLVGPVLQEILNNSNPPDAIRALLDEAIAPKAQFSAVLEQVFVYGIVSQIVGASVVPFLQGVTNDLWVSAVSDGIAVPLSPATLATAIARGLEPGDSTVKNIPDKVYAAAAESGVSKPDFDLLTSIVGSPPALQELFELYRRELIGLGEVETGLKEGDFRDDWIERTVGLVHAWLTPLDFVRAAVQAQMPYEDARKWAKKTGLDVETELPLSVGKTEGTPDMFGLAWAIAGRPPGPQELGRMALRGFIPWEGTGADETTFQQGIAESDVKTKWTDSLRRLQEYFPPPESVGSLFTHGAITEEQAVKYWEDTGVPSELAQAYVYVATQQHIGQDKLAAAGEVKTAYLDGILDHAQAKGMLEDLGQREGVAELTLEVLDFRREIQAINAMVKRVQALYVNHTLSAVEARAALEQIGVPHERGGRLIEIWDAVRTRPIHLPSVREIGLAVKYGTINKEQAIHMIEGLGYEAFDAAVVLSAHSELFIEHPPETGLGVTG